MHLGSGAVAFLDEPATTKVMRPPSFQKQSCIAAGIFIAAAFSVCAQTPIISYDFEGASGGSVPNVGSLGSTYNATAGSEISFNSASGFGVSPTAGSFSFVNPSTFATTSGYSLAGLGNQVALFGTASAGSTDANNKLAINNTAGVTSIFASAPGTTYSGWIYFNNVSASQNLFYIGRNSANSVRWSVGTGATLNDQYRTGSTLNNDSSGTLVAGQWAFITATISPATPSSGHTTWTAYINGAQVGTGSWSDSSSTYPNETSTSGATVGTQTSGAGAFSGYMDDINLYNSALSASQVASLYDSYLAAPVPEPGTFAILGIGLAGFIAVARRGK